ncbi:sugar transferase [Puia sp.]|uniref:sugar transferase n=1 Tax=Puia sp. TaxID=2045100 RepID=UPI002F4050A2
MVILKRAFDLLISTLVILGVLSWLLPILAWMIKRDSPGPVFFVQKRVGKAGKLFRCFKLRSMVVNQHADQHPVAGGDGRITPLGSWLRLSHLDELPQFFNVFLGSMSLVGPRPYMPSDCHRFAMIIPDPGLREQVKPGITGMAQSKGLHGIVCHRDTLLQRYYWDDHYVRNGSLVLDMKILWSTFLNLLLRRRPDVPRESASAPSDQISVLHLGKRKALVRRLHSPRRSH